MTTATTFKAKLIHKEDQIYSYRGALFAKNKEAANQVEAWLVNVNGVEHKARTKKMAKEIIDYIVEANQVEADKEESAEDVVSAIMGTEAAQEETFTIIDVATAMCATGGVNEVHCWYNQSQFYKPINYGVAQGWLTRPSTTQVFWTEKGAELLKAEKEKVETAVAKAQSVAQPSHKNQGVTNAPKDYVKTFNDTKTEKHCPKVEIWTNEPKGNKVRIYMSKDLFKKEPHLEQIRKVADMIESMHGVKLVISFYRVNSYMTIVDNCTAAHEFVQYFHAENGWLENME